MNAENLQKPQLVDAWASGAAYETYVGRWSRLVAGEFLTWLQAPPACRWLDAGCGTGALAETIVRTAAPSMVDGVDASAGFVPYVRRQIPDPCAHFLVGDMQALPFGPATFDLAVSGLVLNFVADQRRAVMEMARVLRPGGTVALYVWDYAGEMQFMRYFWDAAAVLDPAAAALDEGPRFPICQPAPLINLLQAAGLRNVQVRALDVPTVFRTFNDYWSPFLGGQGPAPTYTMALNKVARVALRERLQADLPIAADGSIRLTARAWAVRGVA